MKGDAQEVAAQVAVGKKNKMKDNVIASREKAIAAVAARRNKATISLSAGGSVKLR